MNGRSWGGRTRKKRGELSCHGFTDSGTGGPLWWHDARVDEVRDVVLSLGDSSAVGHGVCADPIRSLGSFIRTCS